MNLSSQQILAVTHGEAVPVIVEGTRCVLIREDIYSRVKNVVYDEMDPEETYPAILAAWDQEADPGLDAYQDYKRKA